MFSFINDPKYDRRAFGQAVRYHNYLVKSQREKDHTQSQIHQEKMYRDNFWEFAKKTVKGELDKTSPKPTFSKDTADVYYRANYSVPPEFDPASLNWFPYVRESLDVTPFNQLPVRPRDIKTILSKKKPSSAPGIDGVTYGILRHLPSTHHFLATLYSKILSSSPSPPDLWRHSMVTLIYKRNEPANPKNFRMIALTSARRFAMLIDLINQTGPCNRMIDCRK